MPAAGEHAPQGHLTRKQRPFDRRIQADPLACLEIDVPAVGIAAHLTAGRSFRSLNDLFTMKDRCRKLQRRD